MTQDYNWQSYTVPTLAFTTIALGIGLFVATKKKKNPEGKTKDIPRPEKWVRVGKVTKLIVYPVKSCQGVEVEEAVLTTLGLKFTDHNIRDRDFMIVDKHGRMQTMTTNLGMSFITMKPDPKKKNHLVLSAPGMDDITLTYPDANSSEERFCNVKHDKQVKALDCGDEVATWIQTFLNKEKEGYRLYYHHINKTQRTFEPYMYDCPMFENSDMGSFHNETSYLMVAQESIDLLNERLDNKSSWKNWRPTILIDKVSEPFAEVNWSFVKFGSGNGILKSAVPCYRCTLTTVDQEAGILPKDGEPLKTLRQMNNEDVFADRKLAELLRNKGIMGLRLGLYLPAGEGAVIRTGDPVYAALL